jgi:hypothetical protein
VLLTIIVGLLAVTVYAFLFVHVPTVRGLLGFA